MTESETRKYYNRFSSTYSDERKAGYFGFVNEMESALLRTMAPGKRVLELGCGTGLIMDRVRDMAPARLAGVDLSPGMLNDALDKGHDVVCGSVTDLPFPDGCFDVIYSFKVLPHVPDLKKALGEAARVLSPGGSMLVELYNPLSIKFVWDKLRQAGGKVYLRHDTPRDLREALPPGFSGECVAGIRIFGLAAWCYRGILGKLFTRVDRAASRGPLRFLAGYQVFLVRRCLP